MKKFLLIVLALTTILGMVACTNTESGVTGENTNAPDTGNAQIDPADVVLFGGDDDYRIVYSSNATSAVKDLIVQMSSDVKAVTGENPKRVGDNAKNEFEQPRRYSSQRLTEPLAEKVCPKYQVSAIELSLSEKSWS